MIEIRRQSKVRSDGLQAKLVISQCHLFVVVLISAFIVNALISLTLSTLFHCFDQIGILSKLLAGTVAVESGQFLKIDRNRYPVLKLL